jgi:glutathione synthase/RimK-type ligase-like ATP-grasp enzyme
MNNRKIYCAILRNESDDTHLRWVNACDKYELKYDIIDMFSYNWLERVSNINYNLYLACPSGQTQFYKNAYDEKINIIANYLNKFVYPSYNEILLHENKIFLSYWLDIKKLPHPRTYVFYDRLEAEEYADNCAFPIVAKSNIGASGSGVRVIKNKPSLNDYIDNAFKKGVKRRIGPNLIMGNIINRLIHSINNPGHIIERLRVYKRILEDKQKYFVLLQEYIPHDYEWRIVNIGSSYFAHKKIKRGDKASGTKGIKYDLPSHQLLDFIKNICDRYKLDNVAIDLFEHPIKGYLINEIQTVFGHIQNYICARDGIPGRLLYVDEKWIFDEGLFNENLSYDLRLISILKKQECVTI